MAKCAIYRHLRVVSLVIIGIQDSESFLPLPFKCYFGVYLLLPTIRVIYVEFSIKVAIQFKNNNNFLFMGAKSTKAQSIDWAYKYAIYIFIKLLVSIQP